MTWIRHSVTLLALSALTSLTVCGCSHAPPDYGVYGAPLRERHTLPANEVFEHPERFDGKKVRLAGTIDAVCAKRGCWLTVREGDRILRARFVESGACSKGFLVPRDAGGREVILEGTVRVEELSQDMARHYLEDGGAPQSEIDKIVGPQKALAMVCTSVAIADGDTLGEPVKP